MVPLDVDFVCTWMCTRAGMVHASRPGAKPLALSESNWDGPGLCDGGGMNFGRDANPLLVTIFLAVWTIVGILYLIDALKGM